MTTISHDEYEDIQRAIGEGRRPREKGPYKVLIGTDALVYQDVLVEDSTPTGRQLLDDGGFRPADEHIIFAVLGNGLLEELRLDETFDLRQRGAEKFLAFKSDRSFRIILDGRQVEWGGRYISGLTLLTLAQVDPATYRVWQQVRGDDDKPIGPKDLVDLEEKGVERFFTGQASSTEGSGQEEDAVLPSKCRRYLQERGITFEEVREAGQCGIILRGFALPEGRFSSSAADILILLPASYPDAAPDMFYAVPWLRLAHSGRDPNAASVPCAFAGQSWQRWSRHNSEWRAGVDGIWTMLKRVETALAVAA